MGDVLDKRYRYLAKNTGMLTISSFSSKVLVFLLVPLYTHILTTAEYGTYDIMTTTISLMMPILSANISDGVMRFAMDKSVNIEDVVKIGYKYIFIATVISGLIIGAVVGFNLWPILKQNAVFVWLLFEFTLLYQFFMQLAKGLEQVKDMAVAGILCTATAVLGNILFLLILRYGVRGFYMAYILGHMIPTFYLFVRLNGRKYFSRSVNKKLEVNMLQYAVPLIMNTLGWWANNTSDRYIVTAFCGFAVNGIYSVAYKIPTILNTLQSIFTQAWQISAIKEYGNKESEAFYDKMIIITNAVMCTGCSVLIILTKFLARILYANDFFQAWKYVPFLLVSSVINTASGVLGPILSARKNSKAMATSAMYGIVTNILLNIILVIKIGAQGAAIATAISSLVIYLSRYSSLHKDMALNSNSRVLLSWLILSIQAFIQVYFDRLYWGQCICLGLLIIMFRKLLREMLSKLVSYRFVKFIN